jgi:hypothetical protein
MLVYIGHVNVYATYSYMYGLNEWLDREMGRKWLCAWGVNNIPMKTASDSQATFALYNTVLA